MYGTRKNWKTKGYEFLAGLNRDLDDVKGRISSRRPLPSSREAFAEVCREENRRKVMLKEGKHDGLEEDDAGSTLLSREIGPNGSVQGVKKYGPNQLKRTNGRARLLKGHL